MDDRNCAEAALGMDIDVEDTAVQVEAAGEADPRVPIDQAWNVSAIHGILWTDLENVYVRMFRSLVLSGARYRAPRTVAMAATQLCAGANRVRCGQGSCLVEHLDGTWRLAGSSQCAASLRGLEEAVHNTPVGTTRGSVCRTTCNATADPARLATMLQDLQLALQAGGIGCECTGARCGFRCGTTPLMMLFHRRPKHCCCWLHVSAEAWCCWELLRKVTGAWQ